MTRRKRKQPVRVSDIKQGKDGPVSCRQLTENGEDDVSGIEDEFHPALETKTLLNGHHEPVNNIFENSFEEDSNGNTLVDTRVREHEESGGRGGGMVHGLKNNCKVQLSKVRFENFCSKNDPDVPDSNLSDEPTDLTISDGGYLNNEVISDCKEDADLKIQLEGANEETVKSESIEREAAKLEDEAAEEKEGIRSTKGEDVKENDFDAQCNNVKGALAEEGTSAAPNTGSPAKTGSVENDGDTSKALYRRRRPMETPEEFICQLCQLLFDNPRDLTIHIRGHNEASSHTCNICGKKLSSASSLDRHMLIHSGERPFQCPMCDMSFTTNGNMNRHLRTHEKGAKEEQSKYDKIIHSGEGAVSGDETDESLKLSLLSPAKRAKMESKQSHMNGMSSDNDMTCPVCHKTFICRIGFETHRTFHPDMTLNCVFCNVSFRNQRGLRMHLCKVHKKDAIDEKGFKSSTGGSSSPAKQTPGIDGLCVAEFSTTKFPHIARLWCEEHSLVTKEDDRTSICLKCKKAFPCVSALNLHYSSVHGGDGETSLPGMEDQSGKTNSSSDQMSLSADEIVNNIPKSPKDSFMSALSLQPTEDSDSDLQVNSSSPFNLPNQFAENQESAWYEKKNKNVLNRGGLWKGFPVINFDYSVREQSGRTGRPLPTSFSPLKGEMASGAPKKPCVGVEDGGKVMENKTKAHGPLSRRQDAEPVTGDVGVGMLTPAEFASANSHIDEDELEREREMTEDGNSWREGSSSRKYNHVCKFCNKAFPFRSTLKVHVRSHMGLTPYKCMLCDYSSADKSTLVRHMRTHSGERPYSCKLCGFPFTTKANCERHVKKRHGKLSKMEVDIHIQHHPLQRLPEQGQFCSPDTICKVCNRDFKFFRDLQNHMRIHEKSPTKIFACIKCNMNFSKKNQCVRHMLRKHRHLSSSEIQQHVQNLSEKEEKAKIKKEEENRCSQHLEEGMSTFRESPFTHLSSLPRPVPVYVANNCRDASSDDIQEEPLDLSLPKKGNCPSLLSPNVPSSSIFSDDVSGADGTYLIGDSSYSIIPDSNVDGAMRYKDPYRKFYSPRLDALVCPHCLRLFKKGSRLKTHIRSHTRERPFRCSMCSAAFTQSSSLDEHMIKRHCDEEDSDMSEIQSGVTPMQVKLINRDATQMSILKNCLQRKDGPAAIGQLINPTGGNELMNDSNVENATSINSHQADSNVDLSSISKMLAATDSNNFQHYMSPQLGRQNFGGQSPSQLEKDDEVSFYSSHTEDAMMEDSKLKSINGDCQQSTDETEQEEYMKFSRSGKLESRQTCPYCQRKFPWVSSLRRHLITHTGLKPYECPHCGATFSTKSNCERHINRRHQGQKGSEVEDSEQQKDPFKCKVCHDLAFSTKRKLQKHYKDEHPLAQFPKEYMEAPDVIVNNKDLIEKIQQGYDPVLSPSVSGIVPEGTKKRNQLFFGSQAMAKVEPTGQSSEEKIFDDSSSVQTSNSNVDQEGEDFLESIPFHESGGTFSGTSGDVSPFVVKEENVANGYSTGSERLYMSSETTSLKTEEPNTLLSNEVVSDKNMSEDDGDENSDSDSQVSYASGDQTMPSMVGDLSSATSLVIPQVTFSTKKGKKGARFNCGQCCKKFKSEQTLCRHLKVHQLEHPFKCTECSATFTTKFNCQRHIMKLHGKSKEEVMNITGCGKVSETTARKLSSASNTNNNSKPSPSKRMKIDQDSPVLFSYAANVGLGTKVVSILPQRTMAQTLYPSGKNISNQKLKNILPKVESKKAKRQTLVDHSDLSQLTSPYQSNILFTNREESKEELIASSPDALHIDDASGETFKYSPSDLASNSQSSPSESGMVAGEGYLSSNSDLITNLLGIKDPSTMDQIMESADSAAKILGVQG